MKALWGTLYGFIYILNRFHIIPGQGHIRKACSQIVCPPVVSMVFDVTEMKVYWCENRQWGKVKMKER